MAPSGAVAISGLPPSVRRDRAETRVHWPGENPGETEKGSNMSNEMAHQRVNWCNKSIHWTAVAVEGDQRDQPRNVMWSYRLDGLTFYGFPFDPTETDTTTRLRALNWLNRHHLIVRRQHLAPDLPVAVR